MDLEEISLRATSLLRRAGLASVPRAAIAGVAVLAFALVCICAVHFWPHPGEEFTIASANQVQDGEPASSEASSSAAQNILVDIEGAVCAPGLYSLAQGARVGELVSMAGGFSENAAPAQVNLARKLEDGEQVYVPSADDISQAPNSAAPSGAAGASASGASTQGAASDKININTASSDDLQKLTGIGPSLAERIIEYRETNGRFSSVDDLQNVSGIGKTRFANIKDKICV